MFKAAPLHDIGKVGIPDSILLKPGKLTPEEFEIMKTHTIIGENTLLDLKQRYSGYRFLELAVNIARHHHERWDGTGYPDGLSGQSIPLSARIMAVADTYDALRSKRVYKDAISHNDSVEVIRQSSGTHFDPEIVEVFIECENEIIEIYEREMVRASEGKSL
jgi:putative two-component system response regulator